MFGTLSACTTCLLTLCFCVVVAAFTLPFLLFAKSSGFLVPATSYKRINNDIHTCCNAALLVC